MKAEVVVCGAGIAGITAVYHLSKLGIKDIILIDSRPPLTFTSDKSSESYRNWWPSQTMAAFMDHSIDLMEELAIESNNIFQMNRRGYVYMTGETELLDGWRKVATRKNNSGYAPSPAHDWQNQPNGADFIDDRTRIHAAFPFLNKQVTGFLHTRRCGWLSAQQLGMHLLDEAKKRGVRQLEGEVTAVSTQNNRIQSVTADGKIIKTHHFINAAGPFLNSISQMMGVSLPVHNELHTKLSFDDPLGIIPRDAPLMIWNDPLTLDWTDEERDDLASDDEFRWLTEEMPAGLHFRPEGGEQAKTILGIWTYHVEKQTPITQPQFDRELYPEVVLRGLSKIVPDLAAYRHQLHNPFVDGGYYCKTAENRPLIGRLPVEGAFVIGALSGYGIMGAMAAGELLAAHVVGGTLPIYAADFAPSRYENADYMRRLPAIMAQDGQL